MLRASEGAQLQGMALEFVVAEEHSVQRRVTVTGSDFTDSM